MAKPFISIAGALVLCAAGSGCVSLAEYEDLKARYSALAEKNQRITEDLGRRNADLEQEVAKKDAQIETKAVMLDAKDKELAAARAIREEIEAKFASLVPPAGSSGESDIEYGANWIRFSGEVLFDAGKTEIKPQGKALLLEVARQMKEKGLYVQVDGHTDTDPIKRSLGKFPSGSNFELGAMRALSVLLLMQKDGGLDSAKLHLVSWGEHQPAEQGNKRKNRRVEIRFTEKDPYLSADEIANDK